MSFDRLHTNVSAIKSTPSDKHSSDCYLALQALHWIDWLRWSDVPSGLLAFNL